MYMRKIWRLEIFRDLLLLFLKYLANSGKKKMSGCHGNLSFTWHSEIHAKGWMKEAEETTRFRI